MDPAVGVGVVFTEKCCVIQAQLDIFRLLSFGMSLALRADGVPMLLPWLYITLIILSQVMADTSLSIL